MLVKDSQLYISSCSKLLLGLMASVFILMSVSCSKAVTVDKRAAHQTINKNRDNIVTDYNLSIKTSSQLVATGIESGECIAKINACIQLLNKNIIHNNQREALALFAELHLAKAKAISANSNCHEILSRPPIDPYYVNAPLSTAQQTLNKRQLNLCRQAYRTHTMAALKNSYAYLFYDELSANASKLQSMDSATALNKPHYLAKDLDIQTKDVYEAASDILIKHIYSRHSQETLQSDKHSAKVTFFVNTGLFDIGNGIIKPQNTTAKFREQIRLLNVTFKPDLPTKERLATEPVASIDDLNDSAAGKDSLSTHKDSNLIEAETVVSTLDMDSINSIHSIDNPDIIENMTDYQVDAKPVSVDVYVPNEPEYLQNTPRHNHRISELYASHDLNFSDLKTISRREGLGVSYVTLFEGRLSTSVTGLLRSKTLNLNAKAPEDRIRLTGNVLLSAVVIPKGNTIKSVLQSHDYDIKMYNPHHTESINILDKPYYLAANFSASYGMWLAENSLDNVSYFSLLSKQQSLILPQLYMLEPYDPDKRVIIMLHGLASSPATWVKVTNDISNDAILRQNYQVWQIFYPTNIPILENRYQIQSLIETAYQINDPDSKDIASQHSLLIGHSMGAVIGRMLLSDKNLEAGIIDLNKVYNNQKLDKLIDTQILEHNIKNRLYLHKLKNVDTAVFISAPFRGTNFADRWFTRAMRRVIQLPLGFVQTIQGNLASIATEGELTANPLGALYLQNGASQLSDQSSFMKLTAELPIADGVTYHSIIANNDSDLYQGLQQFKVDLIPRTHLSPTLDLKQVKANIISSPNLSLDPEKIARPLEGLSIEDSTLEGVAETADQTIDINLSDGIVPYGSAHLEGAASETIILGGHGIQETPEAILTLRKLLHEHLVQYPIPQHK